MNFSERDMLMDLLIDAKYISTGYHQAILESSSDRVRNTFMQIHDDELATHKTIFDLMNSRGYYQVQPASTAGALSGQAGMQGRPDRQFGQNMGSAMGNAENVMGNAGGGYGSPYQQGMHQPYQDANRNS